MKAHEHYIHKYFTTSASWALNGSKVCFVLNNKCVLHFHNDISYVEVITLFLTARRFYSKLNFQDIFYKSYELTLSSCKYFQIFCFVIKINWHKAGIIIWFQIQKIVHNLLRLSLIKLLP